MSGPRYRVQVRTHGEPWKTCYAVTDRAIAHHFAARLLEERSTADTARWNYVRIIHGDMLLALWQGGLVVIHDTQEVAS